MKHNKALLLLNMGGVNRIEEVKLFLHNMFSDKNILPVHPLLRRVIRTIIIKKRLKEAESHYAEIGGKSRLTETTNALIDKLKTKLNIPIYPAMRYVPPFANDALKACQNQGVEELILFPMYPHYSTTTTLSSIEDIKEQCKKLDYHPKISVISPYYDDYDYIKASVEKILEASKNIDTTHYDLLLSAHGLPVSIIKTGDPYEKHIEANVSAIKIYLHERGVKFRAVKLVYQSKVGPSKWLEPNLVDVLRNPTNDKVLLYPLAFTIDNSETDFELDIEHREIAEKIKYKDYIVARCMNDSESFTQFIVDKVMPYL